MKKIDINCDIGESFGAYKLGNDREVLKFVSSANIACGYHAGDHNVMMDTVREAAFQGVNIGAHPGLPDLQGFGRRDMNLEPNEIYNLVLYQLGAISAFAKANNVPLSHVKPHGALYNLAAANKQIAESIALAVANFDKRLVLFGLSGSELITAGREKGLRVASEVFADRTYQRDGSLTPRREKNSVIHDAGVAISQAIKMATEGKVIAVDGSVVDVEADTICIHGDSPKALEFAEKLNAALTAESISLRKSWDELC